MPRSKSKKSAKLSENLTLYQQDWNGDPADDRMNFIGGSDTGTILGINPYKSAYTLWLEKTGQLEPPDLSDKVAVKVGHAFEEGVAKMYEAETGHQVEESIVSYMCKEYPYLRAHVDRLVVDDTDRGLECKTTSSHNHYDYLSGDVPPYYYSQCQFYMMLTGRHKWDLATLKDNTDFFINEIEKDDEYIEYMLNAIIDFWNHVQSRTPPEIDYSPSTTSSLTALYKGGSDIPIDLSSYDELIKTREEAAEQETYWKNIKNQYDNELRDALGDSETGTSENYIVTWKTFSPKLDSKKVRTFLSDDDYQSCLGEPSRVLRIKRLSRKEK